MTTTWEWVLWVSVIVVAAFILKLVCTHVYFWCKYKGMNKAAREAQVQKMTEQLSDLKFLLSQYPNLSNHLEEKILDSDTGMLIEMLDNQELTSVQLLTFYLRRCIDYGIRLNAIVDFNHREAMETAMKCDSNRRGLPKDQRPPLYGIPMSLKNNFIQKNFDTSLAMVQHYGKIHSEDGLITRALRELGAIPFVRTNLPVGVIGNENHNYIYGKVLSPWSPERTPGGSSGGEAVLVASGCTPLGFATDAAGSVRTPALFCGLYAMMISPHRTTLEGAFGLGINSRGLEIGAVGPIARSTRDLVRVVSGLVNNKDVPIEDKTVLARPWNVSEFNVTRKLRIGVLSEDKYFTWTAPQHRVLGMAVNALRSKGHEIIDFGYKNWGDVVRSFMIIAGNTIRDRLHMFEPNYNDGESKLVCRSNKVPTCLINIVRKLVGCMGKKYIRPSEALRIAVRLDEEGILKQIERHRDLMSSVDNHFASNNIDALLVPGLNVAYRHLTSQNLSATHSSHIFANAANLCAGVMPIDLSREDETTHSDEYDDMFSKHLDKNMRGGAGLPLGVQICARNGHDEVCLRVMQEIEDVVGFKRIVKEGIRQCSGEGGLGY